jgi:hypothetical protein
MSMIILTSILSACGARESTPAPSTTVVNDVHEGVNFAYKAYPDDILYIKEKYTLAGTPDPDDELANSAAEKSNSNYSLFNPVTMWRCYQEGKTHSDPYRNYLDVLSNDLVSAYNPAKIMIKDIFPKNANGTDKFSVLFHEGRWQLKMNGCSAGLDEATYYSSALPNIIYSIYNREPDPSIPGQFIDTLIAADVGLRLHYEVNE